MSDDGSDQQWAPPAPNSAVPPAAVAPPLPPAGPPTAVAPQPVGVPRAEFSFEPDPEPRRRSRVAVGGIAVGVMALGAAGVFAATQIVGGNDGGAESPEAVGTALMASLEEEDVLGMIDLLLPGERETFREPLIDLVSELTRIEVLSQEASLDNLAGLEIDLVNEATLVEPTNVDDISNITMTADMTASYDGEQLPIGDLVADLLGDDFDLTSLSEPEDNTEFDVPVTVVRHDGRWYLSVLHTWAEEIRGDSGGSPIPETGIVPRGGDTPEGAIDALLDAVDQLDLSKLIAGINPNEAQALQRYAPLFLTDAQRTLDEAPLSWQVTQTEYDVVGDGDKRFVNITAMQLQGDFEGEPFSFVVDGDCVVIDAADQHLDSCDAQQEVDLEEVFGESESIDAFLEDMRSAMTDYDQPGITVQKVDGQWFVSPAGTYFDQILAVLRALDRQEVETLIDHAENIAAEFANEFGAGFDPYPPVFEDVVFEDDFFEDDEAGEILTDPGSSEEFDSFEQEQEIATECYVKGDVVDVVGCLQDSIDTGALPAYYLGVELEYPECGVAEVSIDSLALYALSDEDYTAMIEQATTCFQGLIDAGTIVAIEVPSEYLKPECAEGRNPWTFDDSRSDNLFDRWVECVYS